MPPITHSVAKLRNIDVDQSSKEPTTSFLDLAPEIRDLVYNLVVPHDCQLAVKWKPKKLVGGPRHSRLETTLSLLRVNRQVQQDVLPILYGANKVMVYGFRHMKNWACGMGNLIVHVREACVYYALSPGMLLDKDKIFKAWIALLCKARNLRRLLVDWHVERFAARNFGKIMLPLCLMVASRKREQDPACDIDKVLETHLRIEHLRGSSSKSELMGALAMMVKRQLRTPEEEDGEETEVLGAVQNMFQLP